MFYLPYTGTCAATPFEEKYGLITFFIVTSEWRGKGVGRHLMDLAMGSLGDRGVILDAAKDKPPMYQSKWGFRLEYPEFPKIYYDIRKLSTVDLKQIDDVHLIHLEKSHLDDLITYDNSIVGNMREYKDALLKMWVDSGDTLVKLCAINHGDIIGYLFLRCSPHGCSVTMNADDGNIAQLLLVEAAKHIKNPPHHTVSLYVPIGNVSQLDHISKAKIIGTDKIDFRMVKGIGPMLDWSKVFGYTQSSVNII